LKRKLLLIALALLFLCAGLTIWVGVPTALDLFAARGVLTGSPADLRSDKIRDAKAHLASVSNRLDSWPARLLRIVPIARQNLGAVEALADAAVPALDSGLELKRRTDDLERHGLLEEGTVRLPYIENLEEPLRRESDALAALEASLEEHRSGWLLPPLWNRMDDLLERVAGLHSSAEKASDLVAVAPALLGRDGPRTYLVLLLNNTELRGAGGILSGVGTVTASGGRLRLGHFDHYPELSDPPPYRRVPAPADFARHFGRYRADTTRWVSTSSSPDVPDVALVSRRLYELVRGTRVDGALVIDPRGLAALAPPGRPLRVPSTQTRLLPDEVADYVYSRAYRQLGGASPRRREAIIDIGEAAFQAVLTRGLPPTALLGRTAGAVRGGHLRFVSFDRQEEAALAAAGLTGDLGEPPDDGMLATVQNYGGNKLDFYARRRIRHFCTIRTEEQTDCMTEVTIENHTPRGLTPYEYQYLPYGLFKNFVEIYVPDDARLSAVEIDGEAARFTVQAEDGYKAVGSYQELARNKALEMTVSYRLPPAAEGFETTLVPQPLTHDASLSVRLLAPSTWEVEGPQGLQQDGDAFVYRRPFSSTIKFEAGPPEGKTGLAALWDGLVRFWNEPLF
jgi:Protein of unknown function (DUF4012)